MAQRLGETWGWGDNPIYKGLSNNRNALINFGAGLASGGLSEGAAGIARGAPIDDAYALMQEEKAAQADTLNQTTEWLRQNGHTNLLAAVESGAMTPGDAFKVALQPAEQNRGVVINGRLVNPLTGEMMADYSDGGGATAPSNVQEWQYYSQLAPEEQSQYLNMKRSNTPLNIGTGFVTQDQANPGSVIGAPIAIQNEQKAFDTAVGSGLGTDSAANTVLYESVARKMPGLRKVIGDLTSLADTATYTQSGQAMDSVKRELGLDPGQGAIDRASYVAIVDNQVLPLLKDTFGAAFTVQEGESLRRTLGDPNASPKEKKAILDAFIAQKERDVASMASRGMGGGTPPAQDSGPRTTSTGVQFTVGP